MLIKVIDTKSVFGDKAALQRLVLSDESKSHFLYRIVGEVQGFMQGKGKHQRVNKETGVVEDTFWTKFGGDFVAVNCRNEQFESATCFLPAYVAGPIKAALEADPNANPVFKFDIYTKYNKDSATSYEFIAQPIRQGNENTAAMMLAQLPPMPGAVPALPAPPPPPPAQADKAPAGKK